MDGKDIDTEQFKKVCKSQRCMCICIQLTVCVDTKELIES